MHLSGFLTPALTFTLIFIGVLSGAGAVIREIQAMYHPAVAEQKRVFWAFVRIAFVVSAVVLWANEHEKVSQLSDALNAKQNPIIVNIPPISLPPATAPGSPQPVAKPKAAVVQPDAHHKGGTKSPPEQRPVEQTEPSALPVIRLTATQEPTNSTLENARFAIRVVIQTNTSIQPTSLVLVCDTEVEQGDFSVSGVYALRSSGTGWINGEDQNPNKKMFWLFFADPPFRPETPVIVTLMAQHPIRVTAVARGPATSSR